MPSVGNVGCVGGVIAARNVKVKSLVIIPVEFIALTYTQILFGMVIPSYPLSMG